MSLPRAVIPGRCYLITRRCSERRFLMRPDRETNNAFVYCLALACRKSHVSLVCFGTCSNHYHAVVVDHRGRLPVFLEHFHKLFAKHQNCLRGRWEAFWATEQTSVVELPNPEDVLAKMAYAIANPCSSHLVEKVHHWPGVESLTIIEEDLPLVASKPARFFDQDNADLPDIAQLAFRRAPGFERLSHAEYAKLVCQQVDKPRPRQPKSAARRASSSSVAKPCSASTGTTAPTPASLVVASRPGSPAGTSGHAPRPPAQPGFPRPVPRRACRPPGRPRGGLPARHLVALPLRRPHLRRARRHRTAELSCRSLRLLCGASPGPRCAFSTRM